MSDLIGFPTAGLLAKKNIVDIRMVMFPKMMIHPETKQMVMVPMQDLQYKREGSDKWFSVPVVETEQHDFTPEVNNEEVSNTSNSGVILS